MPKKRLAGRNNISSFISSFLGCLIDRVKFNVPFSITWAISGLETDRQFRVSVLAICVNTGWYHFITTIIMNSRKPLAVLYPEISIQGLHISVIIAQPT